MNKNFCEDMPNNPGFDDDQITQLDTVAEEPENIEGLPKTESSPDSSPTTTSRHIKKDSIAALGLAKTPKEKAKRRSSVRSDALTDSDIKKLNEVQAFVDAYGVKERKKQEIQADDTENVTSTAEEEATSQQLPKIIKVFFPTGTNIFLPDLLRLMNICKKDRRVLGFRGINPEAPKTKSVYTNVEPKYKTEKTKSEREGFFASFIRVEPEGADKEKHEELLKHLEESQKLQAEFWSNITNQTSAQKTVGEFNNSNFVVPTEHKVWAKSLSGSCKQLFPLFYISSVDDPDKPDADGDCGYVIKDVTQREDGKEEVLYGIYNVHSKEFVKIEFASDEEKTEFASKLKPTKVLGYSRLEFADTEEPENHPITGDSKSEVITKPISSDYDIWSEAIKLLYDDLEGQIIKTRTPIVYFKKGQDEYLKNKDGELVFAVKIVDEQGKSLYYRYDISEMSYDESPLEIDKTFVATDIVGKKQESERFVMATFEKELEKAMKIDTDDQLGLVTTEQQLFINYLLRVLRGAINHGIEANNPHPSDIKEGEQFTFILPEIIDELEGYFTIYESSPYKDGDETYYYVIVGGGSKSSYDIKNELYKFGVLLRKSGYPLPFNYKDGLTREYFVDEKNKNIPLRTRLLRSFDSDVVPTSEYSALNDSELYLRAEEEYDRLEKGETLRLETKATEPGIIGRVFGFIKSFVPSLKEELVESEEDKERKEIERLEDQKKFKKLLKVREKMGRLFFLQSYIPNKPRYNLIRSLENTVKTNQMLELAKEFVSLDPDRKFEFSQETGGRSDIISELINDAYARSLTKPIKWVDIVKTSTPNTGDSSIKR